MHAKSLNTDKAWDAYEMLVDDYYSLKEKNINSPSYTIEDPIKRAEQWITEQREKMLLIHKIELDKPLVTFAETVLKSSDNILVRELSKIIQDEGIDIGEKKLFRKLREWRLILTNSTEPSQFAMNNGIFVVEEKSINTPYGVRLSKTTKVTPRGQIYIIERLKKHITTNTQVDHNKLNVSMVQ
jgi:phage antirepressor YoqD-like protein